MVEVSAGSVYEAVAQGIEALKQKSPRPLAKKKRI
jgi:hypothetical protein